MEWFQGLSTWFIFYYKQKLKHFPCKIFFKDGVVFLLPDFVIKLYNERV